MKGPTRRRPAVDEDGLAALTFGYHLTTMLTQVA